MRRESWLADGAGMWLGVRLLHLLGRTQELVIRQAQAGFWEKPEGSLPGPKMAMGMGGP